MAYSSNSNTNSPRHKSPSPLSPKERIARNSKFEVYLGKKCFK